MALRNQRIRCTPTGSPEHPPANRAQPFPMKSASRSQFPAGQRMRLAADIGGTFTDVAAFDAATGKLKLGKALSTPHRLVDGISVAVEKAGTAYASAGL